MTHAEFWARFRQHEKRLRDLQANTDRFLGELCEALGAVREGLGVEISDEEHGIRDLMITAGGDATLFDEVKKLVAEAPLLPHWNFIALKPPRGFDFTLELDGVCIAPSDLVFETLACSATPSALGIRVFVPPQMLGEGGLEAVRKVIEIGLGEETAASSIDHLEIAAEPDSTDQYIPLSDLEAYIEWFQKRSSSSPVS